jgi:hypothetical protein
VYGILEKAKKRRNPGQWRRKTLPGLTLKPLKRGLIRTQLSQHCGLGISSFFNGEK